LTSRWLDEEEFLRLYRWLECPDTPVHPTYTRAVRILMLTGQRVEEIARLHVDHVPEVAAELIESTKPSAHRWFFPSATDPEEAR
jgi:integrase